MEFIYIRIRQNNRHRKLRYFARNIRNEQAFVKIKRHRC